MKRIAMTFLTLRLPTGAFITRDMRGAKVYRQPVR